MVVTPGALRVEILPDGRRAKLIDPFILFDCEGRMHEVPAEFVTDFASVPRIFWRLIPPWGPYSGAAVVHDYLYASGAVSRQEADGIFLDLMKSLNVAAWKRWAIYSAVRMFGWHAWAEHRRDDGGEI